MCGSSRKYASKTSIPVRTSNQNQTQRKSFFDPGWCVASADASCVLIARYAPQPFTFRFTDIKYTMGKMNIHTKSTKCQ